MIALLLAVAIQAQLQAEAYAAMDRIVAAVPGTERWPVMIRLRRAEELPGLLAETTIRPEGTCVLHFTPAALKPEARARVIQHEVNHCVLDHDAIDETAYKTTLTRDETAIRELTVRYWAERLAP
jgi:hypothetical protein